jgi:hypothetical protein
MLIAPGDTNVGFGPNGVLTVELTGLIERVGQPWVSELECARHI